MCIKDAIVERFKELCAQRSIKYNELATRSGVTPSTVYGMMNEARRDLSVITMKKFIDGLDMSVTEFFDTEIFRNLEQEIK
ncbi:MAG: helix-turn-helix domain-containing protein [Oscillospiraceae bacterium]|jgi:transcriptional regulator with XRE-family HTH domain|nr:helix-turn-helix domain-containing protein [Oscillospiraceae bacterium]